MSATPKRELRSNFISEFLRLLFNSSLSGSKVFPIYKGFREALYAFCKPIFRVLSPTLLLRLYIFFLCKYNCKLVMFVVGYFAE